MADIKKIVREWVVDYLKHRDLVQGKIEQIKEEENAVIVKYVDKESSFLIIPKIEDINVILNNDKEKHLDIIVLNTKENFNIMVRNWNKLKDYKNLKIMFVNPNSPLEKKWIISPYFHSKICDDSSLKQGLKSMFETVEEFKQ